MSVVREVLYFALLVFLLLLVFRLIMEYVFMLARGFRPNRVLVDLPRARLLGDRPADQGGPSGSAAATGGQCLS